MMNGASTSTAAVVPSMARIVRSRRFQVGSLRVLSLGRGTASTVAVARVFVGADAVGDVAAKTRSRSSGSSAVFGPDARKGGFDLAIYLSVEAAAPADLEMAGDTRPTTLVKLTIEVALQLASDLGRRMHHRV